MDNTEEIYQSYTTYDEEKKTGLIKLRDEQIEAVKQAKEYFEKSKDNNRFLWNAKMRFGKTFCAIELAIEMGESQVDPKGKKDSKPINRVLIITHRPVVKDNFAEDLEKLQNSLRAQGKLKRTWQYGTRVEGDKHGDFDELERGLRDQNTPYIFFASTQWLSYSAELGGKIDDPLRKQILNNQWDLVVIDEAHEGILAEKGNLIVAKLQERNPKMLYMSGTPFNLVEGIKGFSEGQIFSWDYTREQQAKEEWPTKHPGKTNPYQDLPKMNIFAYDMRKLVLGQDYEKGDMFSFPELFRTYVGRPAVDDPVKKQYQATPEEIGKFVHEEDVTRFLDLMYKGDEKTNYPFTKDQYQENFRHTLWIVPGVKAAKALEELLGRHEFWGMKDEAGNRYFEVINVAGTNDDEEGRDDLARVKDAIANKPHYTITLSCGKLTTGVTVPEWTAVFHMKGSAGTSPASYMQTIFRVQSPHRVNGKMKANCYVFDFAPGRSLKVVAEIAKFSRKTIAKGKNGKIIRSEDKEVIEDFTKYCPIWNPVVANQGSALKPISTDAIIKELNKVYYERIAKNGFDDYAIYKDDEILGLSDELIDKTKDIVGGIAGEGKTDKDKNYDLTGSGDGGLTTKGSTRTPAQKKSAEEKWKKEKEAGKTDLDFDAWLQTKDEEKEKNEKLKKYRELIHAITLRIPLLMFGAEVDDKKESITIDNITERTDDASWNEFMPKGATKEYFNKIKHCYDEEMFKEAGTQIRDMARATDEMHIEDRIVEIARIFNYFKNPDKETVLTPWPVVNRHMSDTLGGFCFFDETFKNPNRVPLLDKEGKEEKDEAGAVRMVETNTPREVMQGNEGSITKEIFYNIDEAKGESRTKILEINSKTGLYPLYVAYSIYRPLLEVYKKKHLINNPDDIAVSEEQAIWDTVIKNNVYVICNTDMAARVTYRTLAGYRPIKEVDVTTISEEHYIKGMHIKSDKIIKNVASDLNSFANQIKSPTYWYQSNNEEQMNFNAVVGNPPYQGNSSAQLYPLFYLLSKEIGNIVSLIFPTGWQKPCAPTAKGLARMNKPEIKNDKQIVFIDIRHNVFPNISGASEVNIILWKKNYDNQLDGMQLVLEEGINPHKVFLVCDQADCEKPVALRTLSECVRNFGCFNHIEVSSRTPFGLESDAFIDVEKYGLPPITDEVRKETTDIKIYGSLNKRNTCRFVCSNYPLPKIHDSFKKYKVFIPCAWGNMNESKNGLGGSYSEIILAKPFEVCTKTYTVSGSFDTRIEAFKHAKYILTRFARGLLYLKKFGIQASHTAFVEVPAQTYEEDWWNLSIEEIDQKLVEKYVNDIEKQKEVFDFLKNNIQTRTEKYIRIDNDTPQE